MHWFLDTRRCETLCESFTAAYAAVFFVCYFATFCVKYPSQLIFPSIFFAILHFLCTFAAAIGTLPCHAALGMRHSVGFKRESGEKPEQSRCCKRLSSIFAWRASKPKGH